MGVERQVPGRMGCSETVGGLEWGVQRQVPGRVGCSETGARYSGVFRVDGCPVEWGVQRRSADWSGVFKDGCPVQWGVQKQVTGRVLCSETRARWSWVFRDG